MAVSKGDKPVRVGMVADWARAACAVTESRGPVWVVPQAFNYGLYKNAATLAKSRAPTEQELRCMAFLAIAEGAENN